MVLGWLFTLAILLLWKRIFFEVRWEGPNSIWLLKGRNFGTKTDTQEGRVCEDTQGESHMKTGMMLPKAKKQLGLPETRTGK